MNEAGHGQHVSPVLATTVVLDPWIPLVEAPKTDGSAELHPKAVVEFIEPDALLGAEAGMVAG